MPIRLIGTDSENPRLPDTVIAASVGTTSDDLATGDTLAQAMAYADGIIGSGGGSFVGAFTTVAAPSAASVDVGFYYFDTTLGAPFWSDGTAWVGGGGDDPPPGPVPLTVGFTAEPGESFQPWVGLTADTDVTWHSSTGTVLGTGIQPSFVVPANGIITMDVDDDSVVDFLNFGYDNTQDVGQVSLPSLYNWPPTSLTGVTTSLADIPNIRYFMAADTELTGELVLGGHPHLEHIECFHAHVSETDLTGCTSIVRLCYETTDLSELDVTPCRLTLRDLRAADQTGTAPMQFLCDGDLPNLYHYCVQGNVLANNISLSQMPVLEEVWMWDQSIATIADGDLPVSPRLTSLRFDGNPLTTDTMNRLLIRMASLQSAVLDPVEAARCWSGAILADIAENPLPATANGARALLLSRDWAFPDMTTTGDLTSAGIWPAHTKDGTADGWARVGTGTPPAVYGGKLTFATTGYARYQRAAADGASTTNPTFTVTADRTTFNGTFWGMYCRANASGVNGARALINGTTGAISGIGLSDGSSTGNASITTLSLPPAGWTDAGAHTMSMTLATNQVTVALDGTNCYRATPSPSGGTWGGYYYGFCGNTNYVSRAFSGFTLT